MHTTIVPYLNFGGRCREAMIFYQECLGGDVTFQKVSESPMAAKLPSELGDRIMHGMLVSNHLRIMGSDLMTDAKTGNTIGLCLICNTEEEIRRCFKNLAMSGHVKTPLHQTFWGATYGEIIDRFGMNWMLSYTRN